VNAFARLLLWLFAVLCVLQLAQGGWTRLKTWLGVKFVGATASTTTGIATSASSSAAVGTGAPVSGYSAKSTAGQLH